MSPVSKGIVLALCFSAALCGRAAAAEVCDDVEQTMAATPSPPDTIERWQRHLAEVDAARAAVAVDTVVVGDSLAEMFDAKYWAPKKILNLGIGGDKTQQALWRLNAFDWSKVSTKTVLLILGTNNLAGQKPCAIIGGLGRVVHKLTTIWPAARISYLEIPPRGADFHQYEAQRLQINEAMRDVPGVASFNLDDALTCGWTLPCKNYQPDSLHFTRDGYATILKGYNASFLQASAP
jgi:lysophospholipase L1-like esterase